MKNSLFVLLFALLAGLAVSANAQLIRPNSATAGSEFSSLYDIGNAIDGSGLPADFTLTSRHARYEVNNHWTTENNAIAAGTAFATFFFDTPQTIGQFHLWNHRSNNIANNAFYAVTQFDLVLRDASGTNLLEVLDQRATGGLGDGSVQSFAFGEVTGVRSVLFRIDANSTPVGHTGFNFTGVAEVAFGAAIPEPSTWLTMIAGLIVLGGLARRTRSRVA